MKNPEPVIFFETENWAVRKHAPIKSAKEFLPKEWLDIPTYNEKADKPIDGKKSVRACPGIGDYMQMGYVIPAWCDMDIMPSEDGQYVETRYSDPDYNGAYHPADQVGNSFVKKFGVRTAVKLDCPWKIWSKPGWSLLYQPMWFHQEKNWEAIPGVIDHDLGALISPINIMLKKSELTHIKMGEPICQVIPIKRETVVARTGALSETAVNRHNAIIKQLKIVFAGWSKWQHAKKTYIVDKNDTDLPGDN
mgnify:FL=1|jgi:hypothetical protein